MIIMFNSPRKCITYMNFSIFRIGGRCIMFWDVLSLSSVMALVTAIDPHSNCQNTHAKLSGTSVCKLLNTEAESKQVIRQGRHFRKVVGSVHWKYHSTLRGWLSNLETQGMRIENWLLKCRTYLWRTIRMVGCVRRFSCLWPMLQDRPQSQIVAKAHS
jgi:hypothetical protein